MAIDLKNMSRKELEKLQRDVEKALTRLKKKDMKAALVAAEKAVAAHGFALEDVVGQPAPKKKAVKKPGQAKYRNPADKTQTWTGKGRQPDWYKSAIASGKNPADLEI